MSTICQKHFTSSNYGALLLAAIISLCALPALADTTAYVPTEDGISVLDTTTNTKIGSIPLPQWSGEMVLSPDGKFAYLSNPLGADNAVGSTVEVISLATNTVVASVPVGAQPQGIAITPNGKFVYVTNNGWSSVWVIATDTNSVAATVTTGDGPYGVAITPDGAFAYVTNTLGTSVSVIATATNTVVATIPLVSSLANGSPLSSRPFDIVISADGKRAYVATNHNNDIFVIDTATKTVVNTLLMTSAPSGLAISPDGRFLYTAAGGSIAVIDTTINAIVNTIPEPAASNAELAMSPDGTRLYVSDSPYGEAGTVTVISTATNTVIAAINAGITTGGVVFAPDANQQTAVSSISLNPSSLSGGASSTGTVVLTSAAPSGGATVTLVSSDPSVKVPASVVVAAGNKTADFSITTSTVANTTSATVTATYGDVSKSAQLTVSPAGQVSISSVSANSGVTGGFNATGTVILNVPAPTGGVVVELWTNGSPAFVPASITIPAGATTGNFPITTNYVSSPTQGTITAFYNGLSKTGTITVTPAATLSSVSVSAQTVVAGNTASGTVTISAAAPPGGMVVSLWTNGSPAFVPTSVTVLAGTVTATFPVTTNYVSSPTQGTITAFYNGLSKTATITVTPVPTLLSVSVAAQTVVAGATASGTVTLNAAAPSGGMVVYLWTNGSPAFVPTSVTVPAGAVRATFPITTNYVSSPTQGTITAFYNGLSKTATITVTP